MGILNRTTKNIENLTTTVTNSAIFLKLVVIASFMYTYLKGAYNNCYDFVPFFAIICDTTEDVAIDMCRILSKHKYEPSNRLSWFNTVRCYRETLSKTVPITFITENYTNMRDFITKDDDVSIILEEINDSICYNETIGNIVNKLVIIKYNGNYVVRLSPTDNLKYVDKRSRVRFISIEYCHPNMLSPIQLDVSSGYMRDGNDLFSIGFVQRLLEYQGSPYIFDETYTLKLMDDCMSVTEIDATKYIHLELRKFKVKEIPCEPEDPIPPLEETIEEETIEEIIEEETIEEIIEEETIEEETIEIDETGIPLISQKIEEETEL